MTLNFKQSVAFWESHWLKNKQDEQEWSLCKTGTNLWFWRNTQGHGTKGSKLGLSRCHQIRTSGDPTLITTDHKYRAGQYKNWIVMWSMWQSANLVVSSNGDYVFCLMQLYIQIQTFLPTHSSFWYVPLMLWVSDSWVYPQWSVNF